MNSLSSFFFRSVKNRDNIINIAYLLLTSTLFFSLFGCSIFPANNTLDPMKSGYDLLAYHDSFVALRNELDQAFYWDEDEIKTNLPTLISIAEATNYLVVTAPYQDAKDYLYGWMSTNIGVFHQIIEKQPIDSMVKGWERSIYYYDLFSNEMKYLGH